MALFLRDDLLSWHASKTAPRSEADERHMEQQLRERVKRNVRYVLAQVARLKPASQALPTPMHNSGEDFTSGLASAAISAASVGAASSAVDREVFKLIAAATDEGNLSRMPPTWQPWL